MRSNYVVAGFETLATIIDNFIKDTKGRYDNQFTRDDMSNFLRDTCGGFLHSFGQNFKDKKKYDKHKAQEAQLFEKCRATGLFNDSDFYVDSGGFQISIGLLSRTQTDILFKQYYEFLQEYYDVYDRAFILDIPPGPNCPIFDSFDDVYKYNIDSYNIARSMPKHVKDKIIYIHHFRTPKLWDVFTDILHSDDMFNEFQHHGTGGIVANLSSDSQIPCVIYVLPMIPLINQALKFGRKTLDFHVLGGANFRDILFYELFRKHILEVHGIEINITYDSSGLFKGLMVGRRLFVNDNEIIKKVDLRSNLLHLKQGNAIPANDLIERSLLETSNRYSYLSDIPTPLQIYDDATGTFFEEIKVYLMLQSLDLYCTVQENMRNFAEESYELYISGAIDEFNLKVGKVTQNLNQGKITKKQATKTYSISRSLDMLTTLDEDYCKAIVHKFLSKDEFVHLTDDKLLKF